MKIKIQSLELPESTIKNFATFLGWEEEVMTVTQSPNYLIDNPQTFIKFVEQKYGTPIWSDIASWHMQKAELEANKLNLEADALLETAQIEMDKRAKQVVSIIVE